MSEGTSDDEKKNKEGILHAKSRSRQKSEYSSQEVDDSARHLCDKIGRPRRKKRAADPPLETRDVKKRV